MGAKMSSPQDPWDLAAIELNADISPAVFEQMNLLTVKQRLRKTQTLTVEQMKVISDVTGEKVRSTAGAINSLVRLFGYWGSDDKSPETLVKLREFDHKLAQVRAALGMPTSISATETHTSSGPELAQDADCQSCNRRRSHTVHRVALCGGQACSPQRRHTISHIPKL